MTTPHESGEIVLVVDDEESVRQTVRDWLIEARLGIQVLTAADSGAALTVANDEQIDLALLDWNLGAGLNGLDLLEDLAEFHPNIVAIMMTAFADQATPLDAMRKGVRDYLDKNQEFTRDNLIHAVERQLLYLRPAKHQRQFHENLVQFRNAIERALSDVEYLAALHDPVRLPDVIGTLFRFLLDSTSAGDGVLFVRHYNPQNEPAEMCRAYSQAGEPLDVELAPFPQSIAASAISLQEPCLMTNLAGQETTGVVLQPFEQNRQSLLAAPLTVASGLHVVLELFDKKTPSGEVDANGFTQTDVRLVRDAGEFGAEILRQALTQRQTCQLLLDAVEGAMHAGNNHAPATTDDASKSNPVLEQLRQSLSTTTSGSLEPTDSVRLAEAIRSLSEVHGPPAVRHCLHLIESLQQLLDEATGI